MSKKKYHKPCTSEAQKKAIRKSYAERARKKTERVEAPFPHFRKYRKSGHPALIVGEQTTDKKEEYRYRKVTHSEYENRHLNEKVYPNPNPSDPEPMYIGKRTRHDEKKHFDPKPLPWKYPKK